MRSDSSFWFSWPIGVIVSNFSKSAKIQVPFWGLKCKSENVRTHDKKADRLLICSPMLANRTLERSVERLEVDTRWDMVALGNFGRNRRRCTYGLWRQNRRRRYSTRGHQGGRVYVRHRDLGAPEQAVAPRLGSSTKAHEICRARGVQRYNIEMNRTLSRSWLMAINRGFCTFERGDVPAVATVPVACAKTGNISKAGVAYPQKMTKATRDNNKTVTSNSTCASHPQ